MERNYRFRQIRINNALYVQLKNYCVHNRKYFVYFIEEVIEWFLKRANEDKNIIYRACSQEEKRITLRIPDRLIQNINILSLKNKISNARVIFTALMLYIQENNI